MKLYVTRHGQTAWNEQNIVCGRTDLPLDPTGEQQAKDTACLLADKHIDRVVCSPMLRARQTAAPILQGRGIPLEIEPRLIEQDYGIYEGASRFDEGFLSHKRSFCDRYPQGESHMLTARRVYACLEDWARRYPEETILMVCHGGICRVIESYFNDMGNEEFFLFAMGNCEIREYDMPKPAAPSHAVKFYGSSICRDCRDTLWLFEERGFTDFDYIDITATTPNLREFLALRDHDPALQESRQAGGIGIPTFVLADGTVTRDAEHVLKLAGK